MAPKDRFQNFRDLAAVYQEGQGFSIVQERGLIDRFLIAAIHGGWIEPHTEDIARDIAGVSHSLYTFEGRCGEDTFHNMHIQSDLFDEPRFLNQATQHDHVVAIHGCQDKWGDQIWIGGMNEALMQGIARSFNEVGLPASLTGHIFLACTPHNACNKGRLGAGVQIEIPKFMREDADTRVRIAKSVAWALTVF